MPRSLSLVEPGGNLRSWSRSLLNFHTMPEDYATPPPPPPPPAPVNRPYGQIPPYAPYPVFHCSVFHGCGLRAMACLRPGADRAWFYIGIITGSLAAVLPADHVDGVGDDAFDRRRRQGLGLGSDRIAVIDITGVILSPETVDSQLRKFGDDSSVKAIILHINSPGGGAAASQEIYHEVLRVRQEKHKKIIASIESVGASGAYYIASGCDKIYANDASVVGSIGVIMEWTNYGDLMRWAKLKNVIIHAGELKDAGDPSRDMTPKEQAYFQSLVDNMYTQFVHDVATGRHSSDDKIKPLATGQVWTGQQSLPLGLIDKVGGYRVALLETAKDVGISGEPSVVRPAKAKRGLLALLDRRQRRPVSQPEPAAEPCSGFLLHVEVRRGPSAFR